PLLSPPRSGLNSVPGSIWDFVSGSFSPSPSPILNTGPAPSSSASPNGTELALVRRQLDEAKRKIRQWEESWQQVKQACDAWQREAKEAKERALAADSARQLALRKKEEVEAQFRRLQEELEGRGLCSALAGLQRCADLGAIPLPKLHSLQSRLRLDLEAVDGVSPGSGSGRPPPRQPAGLCLSLQSPSVPSLLALSSEDRVGTPPALRGRSRSGASRGRPPGSLGTLLRASALCLFCPRL
uniref:Putative E3 ubiquitin-protein ligase UNKL n=1 Tax=Ailuropoda melanoleuca TaxID=9646 RepID=A0A7N5KEU9_AILME